jgi:hypothetical protein
MSPPRFTPEFKEEAVRQITERGYSVAELCESGSKPLPNDSSIRSKSHR